MNPTRVGVRTEGGTVTICVSGRGTFMQAASLRAYVLRGESTGARRFDVGLTACEYMDSTFLGVLAMLAVGRRAGRWEATLVNVPPRVREQIAELGLIPYFAFREQAMPPLDELEPLAPAGTNALERTVREAHEALVHVDPANAPRFADVLSALGKT